MSNTNMDRTKNNQNGSYVIQEQGDLGLGTIKIDPKYVDKKGNLSTPEFDTTKRK